ncbi:MAG: prolyl oligopeptidase family serine peptidase [Pseudomonadota bacterium]
MTPAHTKPGRRALAALALATLALAGAAVAGAVEPAAPAALPTRAQIFATSAHARPAVSPSGHWIAFAQGPSIRLIGADANAAQKRFALPGITQLFWYRWAKEEGDTLIVSAQQGDKAVIVKLQADSGQLVAATTPNARTVLGVATYSNNYAFTLDRFSDPQTHTQADLAPSGALLPVADPKNHVPAFLNPTENFLNTGMGPGGALTLVAGKDEQHRTSLAISQADRRQGSTLVAMAGDGKAYALSSVGVDTLGLLEIDMRSGAKKTLAQEAADIRRVLLDPLEFKPDAVEFETDAPHLTVINPRIQADLDYLSARGWGFPTIVDRAPNDRFWVVRFAHGDGAAWWSVYDRAQHTLSRFSLDTQDLPGKEDWRSRSFRLQRPGEPDISGYVALPRAGRCEQRACPAVLKIHGGPGIRDSGAFDADRFWLTSRGIAVITINFRGSRGFGKRYEALDVHQWAEGIPRDVNDGLAYALRNFPIDSHRIALMGSSFGAYLALNFMAEPARFQCALVDSVSTDMLKFAEERLRLGGATSDILTRVGDARVPKERDLLRSMSALARLPALQSKAILHFQGGQDTLARPLDNQEFVAAMLAKDPAYSHVLMPAEGHGLLGARAQYYALAEQFLGHCLGVPSEPLSPAEREQIATLAHSGDASFMDAH